MQRINILLVTCILATIASPLDAQQLGVRAHDAASKDALRRPRPALAAASPDMTAHCAAIGRLQNAALESATRVQQLSRAPHMNRAAVQAQAVTSHSDLQALLKELDTAESGASQVQKSVIASLLVDDGQAEQHAAEMVSTAQKQGSQGSDIATHASAVVEHVKAAQVALHTDPGSGLPNGERRSLLCAAPAAGRGRPRSGSSSTASPRPIAPSTGQASGKRQY